MWTDLRIALRTLSQARGFTAAAVLSLSLGIGLNATVFAVLNAYLWKDLPYPGAARLYNIQYTDPGQPFLRGLENLDWSSLNDVIEHPISWDLDVFYMLGGDHPDTAPGAWVTADFMQGLGVQPAVGRAFTADEFRSGSPQVALISHSLWRKRFGSDPAVVGKQLEAYVSDRPDEAESFTIIGILPEGFWHVNPYTDVLAPLRAPSHPYFARLRAGVPVAEVERRIAALVNRSEARIRLNPVHDDYVARLRPILNTIAAAAGAVLLIASLNVAFLLLIRSTQRRKEMAIRTALGAGVGRIIRMLGTEAALIGGAALLAGVAFSVLLLSALGPAIQRQLGRPAPGGLTHLAIDTTVLGVTIVTALLGVLLFALAPLLNVRKLHWGSRGGSESKGSRTTRSVLVAAEIACSLALLAGCGLMIRTVIQMLQFDFGLDARNLLKASITLRQKKYPEPQDRLILHERVLQSLGAIPGVRTAASGTGWVMQSHRPRPLEAESSRITTKSASQSVSPDFFRTLGIPLREGRYFNAGDRFGGSHSAIVSRSLAQRLWPAASAIGQRVRINEGTSVWRTVVGIVEDVRQTYADEELADLYIPMFDEAGRFATLYVRTEGSPMEWLPAVRTAVNKLDAEIALTSPGTVQGLVDEQLARPRFLASLLSGLAGFAAMLSLIGVYGVIAYAVRQREREVAVRMAVGADPRQVVNLFLHQGAGVMLAGIVSGLVIAVIAGRSLRGLLYGVEPGDVVTLVAAAGLFAAAGGVAIWWPARNAARTDPALLLRDE